jgi:hypothetical protein
MGAPGWDCGYGRRNKKEGATVSDENHTRSMALVAMFPPGGCGEDPDGTCDPGDASQRSDESGTSAAVGSNQNAQNAEGDCNRRLESRSTRLFSGHLSRAYSAAIKVE